MKIRLSIILILICAFAAFAQPRSGTVETKPAAPAAPTYLIWTPQCETCDSVTIDGATYMIFNQKDFTLTFQLAYADDYYVANVYLVNNSERRIDFNPDLSSIAVWTDSDIKNKAQPSIYSPIPAEKIAAKIQRRAKWANFFSALGGALATTQTGVQSSGSVRVTDNLGNSANGTYNGSATVTSPDREAQRRAQENIASNNARTAALVDGYVNTDLKANTVFPGNRVGGNIYFPKKKFADLMLGVNIEGVLYIIRYQPPAKR